MFLITDVAVPVPVGAEQEVCAMQQAIPQRLGHVYRWASSMRYSHHGIKFGDVIERDQGEVEA